MAQTMWCGCKHDFQDKQNGPGQRNVTLSKDGSPRCTVCGRVGQAFSKSEKAVAKGGSKAKAPPAKAAKPATGK